MKAMSKIKAVLEYLYEAVILTAPVLFLGGLVLYWALP